MAIARLQVQGPRPESAGEAPRRRRRALPAHVLDAPALERRDAPARARAVAPRDGVEPAPARRHATSSTSARSSTRSAACRPGSSARAGSSWARTPALFARARHRPARRLGAGRGARPPAALVRRRRRHARRPARQRVGRRRPRADARRVPDRVEQDHPAHARGGLAGGDGTTPTPQDCATMLGGAIDDWLRLQRRLGRGVRPAAARDRRPGASRCACGCSAAPTSATRA